jgi:hypothetical protein
MREKPVWMSQKFKVSQMTDGYRPRLGGCLVIQCANEDHKLEIWYSPNGETGADRGWVEISAAVNESGKKEVSDD